MKKLLAALSLLTLLLLSGCGASPPPPCGGDQPQCIPPKEDILNRYVHGSEQLGLEPGPVKEDGGGSFRQVVLGEGSSLLEMPTPTLEFFTVEETQAAKEAALRFLVSEAMDSTLAFDASEETSSEWVEATRAYFSASYQTEVAADPSLTVDGFSGSWRERSNATSSSKMGDPRVYLRVLKLDEVAETPTGISFTFDAAYHRPLLVNGMLQLEDAELKQTYLMVPEAGSWKIGGLQTLSKSATPGPIIN